MSRAILAAVFVISTLGVVAAQTPARDASGAAVLVPTGTGEIQGVIKDEAGRPLRRAVVTITGDMRVTLSATTGDDGRFGFSNLPAGRFTVTASKPGYPSASFGANRPNRPGAGVLLTDGQHVRDLALTLARGAALAGTVFDDQGLPMPGVPVMAWEVRTSLAGERTLDFPATGGVAVTTDDRGQYRVFGLPPGEYTVGTSWFYAGLTAGDARVPTAAEFQRAFGPAPPPGAPSSPGPAADPPSPSYNFTRVFHPDAIDPLAAGTVRVSAGDEREGLDIHMQFRPMSRIEGVVTGPDGPIAGVELTLNRRSGVDALNTTTISFLGPDGKFSTRSLAPGDYTVNARSRPAQGEPALWAISDVTINGPDPVQITMRLEPALKLTGRFVFDGATAPPADLTKMRLSLLRTGNVGPQTSSDPPTLNANGTFAIGGVVPGVFRLVANGPAPPAGAQPAWMTRSVTVGGRDVTDLPLVISPGETPELEITLTDQLTELSGTVTDGLGQPAANHFVIVFPSDHKYWTPSSRRIVSARPDATGRYLFRSLPPGAYRIAATTDLVSRDLSDVTALSKLERESVPLVIATGEKNVFDIRLAGR